MEPLIDLLGKFLGAQWLWNLATLALLLQAYKAFSKLQKLPEDALSKSEFQKYKEAADTRFSTIENPLHLISSRVHTLWKKSGISDPYMPRIDVRIGGVSSGDREREANEIVENDPWPRRRATDRLSTPMPPLVEEHIEPRDETRYARDRGEREEEKGGRESDPGHSGGARGGGAGRGSGSGRKPIIPREEPAGRPPSDHPFESDPRGGRRDSEPFDEDSSPPRPKKR